MLRRRVPTNLPQTARTREAPGTGHGPRAGGAAYPHDRRLFDLPPMGPQGNGAQHGPFGQATDRDSHSRTASPNRPRDGLGVQTDSGRVEEASRRTVKNILKENGLDPGTRRGRGTWSHFPRAHAETLSQCDFFSKHIWTQFGPRQLFALAFFHLGPRRVAPDRLGTPDGGWT